MTRRAASAGMVAVFGLAATLAGCGGADGGAGGAGDDLRHDLDAASAAAGLATPIRPHAATQQVVSALELGAAPASARLTTATVPPLRAPAAVRAPQQTPTRVIVRVRYVDAPSSDAVASHVPAGASAMPAAAASGGGGTFSPGTVAGPVQGAGAGAHTDHAPDDGAGRASGRRGSCIGHGRGERGGFPDGAMGLPSGGGGPYRGTI
ncbi:MAG TPA: hypothetical protein VGD56_16365 [Gemmatirosa sp.]